MLLQALASALHLHKAGTLSAVTPVGQSLGRHDKLPRTGRLKQSFIFPQTQRLGVQDQVPAGSVSGWDSPCERARELSAVPSRKATKPATSVNLSYFCGGSISSHPEGLGLQHRNVGVGTEPFGP